MTGLRMGMQRRGMNDRSPVGLNPPSGFGSNTMMTTLPSSGRFPLELGLIEDDDHQLKHPHAELEQGPGVNAVPSEAGVRRKGRK